MASDHVGRKKGTGQALIRHRFELNRIGRVNVFTNTQDFDNQLSYTSRLVDILGIRSDWDVVVDNSSTYNGVCFGTLISTPSGMKPVEVVRVGDQVETVYGNFVTVRKVTVHLFPDGADVTCKWGRGHLRRTRSIHIGRHQVVFVSLGKGDMLFGRSDIAFCLDDMGLAAGIVRHSAPKHALVRLWFDKSCYILGDEISYKMEGPHCATEKSRVGPLELTKEESLVLSSYM